MPASPDAVTPDDVREDEVKTAAVIVIYQVHLFNQLWKS
jgi:hypothetical protein